MRNEEPHGPPAPEPPRREFRFKPTEFEVANRPAGTTPADAPIDVHQLNRLAGSPPPAAGTPAPAENEIHALLRANLAQAEAKGENEVIPRHRISRRKRDYWLVLISGNGLVVASVLIAQKNFIAMILGLSAMVFFSVALTWIMWFLLDDY